MNLPRLLPFLLALVLPFEAWAVADIAAPTSPVNTQNLEAPDEDGDSFAPVEKEPMPFSQPSSDTSAPVEAPAPAAVPSVKSDTKSTSAPDESEGGDSNFERVLLQGLNKVTARAETIDAPIGSAVRLGTIEIVAHRCWKSAPDKRPENAALLEISEIKQGEPPARIFMGWMFSSSPALSALEHPFYDVTVVACEKVKEEPKKDMPQPAPKKLSGRAKPV